MAGLNSPFSTTEVLLGITSLDIKNMNRGWFLHGRKKRGNSCNVIYKINNVEKIQFPLIERKLQFTASECAAIQCRQRKSDSI